jgi:hypothetical protein
MLGSLQRNLPLRQRKWFLTKWLSSTNHFTVLTIVFYGLLAAAMLAPLGNLDGIPNIRDYYTHTVAIIQANMAMSAGQYPLRTMPLEYSGWLYPFYQFYSPTTFTFAALIYKWFTPSNPFFALKLTLWTALTLGGVNMYFLANWFVKSKPVAVLTGVIYLSTPYYIIILTHLGGLNEIVALGFLPALLYFSFQRFYFPRDNSNLVALALIWYLLITIHLVTVVYSGLFIGLLFFLAACRNPRYWRNLVSVGVAVLFGCLLAMWFVAPAVWLQKYFVIGLTFTDTSYIGKVHPLLSNLLFPGAGFNASVSDSLQALRPSVGLPILFSAGLCCYAYLKKLSCGSKRADYWLPYFLTLFFIAFFLVWSPINIWKVLPQPLLVAQYCWRLLNQVTWIGALLSAWAIRWLFKNKLDIRHIVIGSMLLVLSTNVWYKVSQYGVLNLETVMKHPEVPYNRNAYKINFIKYPQFVDRIDSSLIDNELLQTGFEYHIEKPLFRFDEHPALIVGSNIPDTYAARGLTLEADINDKLVATQPVTTGKFKWDIDLQALKNLYPDATPLRLKFYLRDKNQQLVNEKLPIDKVLMTGFIDPATIMRVEQVQPHCDWLKSIWNCSVSVPDGVNFVVLPALYYPKLLNVKIDGKKVNYQSIMFEGSLLAGVSPQAGRHQIRVEFRGLEWANLTSWCAWLALLALIGQMLFYKIRRERAQSG